MEDDFREWAAARMPALVRYAHMLTGNRHQAEDVVQTALTRTLLAWPRVRRKGDPEAYVRQAIIRLVLNSRRRAWRERLTGQPPEAAVEPTGPEERMTVLAALASLPPRQRAVIVLRYYEDMSEARIAEVLGCSKGTVKSQAAKALASLRTHFATVEVTR